ncbi:MAG: ribosome biogenesis GTP-binding protein YihA/YsxC [Nitrospiraceae bacterium]|nr:ribosome biogenesis GTP-binding protein YihA/YsxC [Nitrospiraceae bacterium]
MKILSAEFVTSAAGPKQLPADGKPHIAFAGRSNVGKSSIINSILNRKGLVKTSATPGKTQLINFFLINGSFYFVDLPGYGFARAPRAVVDTWAPMIEQYLKHAPQLRAVIVLLDIRRETDERDLRMLEWLRHYDIPARFILTKADKVNRQEAVTAQRETATQLGLALPPLLTSAKSGQGVGELRAEIARILAERTVGSPAF